MPARAPLLRCLGAAALAAGCHRVPHDATHGDCAECHAPQVEQWQGSRHAVAYSNAVFQRSFADSRDPWCLTCHLPDDGVTCATCHDGRATAQTCHGCHEFDLPTHRDGPLSGTLGQSTVSEWRASGAAAQGMDCLDCHPAHHPRGGNDAERVRQTLSAAVTAAGDTVTATLTAANIGHAFPTGDPFRRLRLTICADLTCDLPIAQADLERRLERTEDGGWALDRDSRIPAPVAGLTGSLTIPLHAPKARSWRLSMHLTDPLHVADLVGEGRYVVDSGPVERP